MKRTLTILVMLAALGLWAGAVLAQAPDNGHGFGVRGFVDENGDGFNDLAPDADGDGIPNGMDPDFVRPLDGSGQRFGFAGMGGAGLMGQGAGHRYGPGDGTGFGGEGPADGTGFGPGTGTGECDGTGPAELVGRRMGWRR